MDLVAIAAMNSHSTGPDLQLFLASRDGQIVCTRVLGHLMSSEHILDHRVHAPVSFKLIPVLVVAIGTIGTIDP